MNKSIIGIMSNEIILKSSLTISLAHLCILLNVIWLASVPLGGFEKVGLVILAMIAHIIILRMINARDRERTEKECHAFPKIMINILSLVMGMLLGPACLVVWFITLIKYRRRKIMYFENKLKGVS